MTPPTEDLLSRDRKGSPQALESGVAGLSGSVLEGRFRQWRGLDGQRYLFSVFPVPTTAALDEVPRFEEAVVLAVARDAGGRRRILFADETGTLPDLFFAGAGLRSAIASGANEIHVHLLADTRQGRASVLRDLTQG